MYLIKSVLLDWYSDKKIIFRMIRWNLASKNDSELWKFPIFDSSDSKSLTRYQKILWVCSLGYKNLLNFAWHSMKFHNCHHASKELLENTSWFHNYPGSAFSGATAVVTTTCVQQGFLAIFPDFLRTNTHYFKHKLGYEILIF